MENQYVVQLPCAILSISSGKVQSTDHMVCVSGCLKTDVTSREHTQKPHAVWFQGNPQTLGLLGLPWAGSREVWVGEVPAGACGILSGVRKMFCNQVEILKQLRAYTKITKLCNVNE